MILYSAESDLERLKTVLPPEAYPVRIQYEPEHDEQNATDPRAFCYVSKSQWTIFCSRSIEVLEPNHRVGILLHEVYHIFKEAFDGPECEVDVDAAILEAHPDADYQYLDTVYCSPTTGAIETAPDLQWVSDSFLESLG